MTKVVINRCFGGFGLSDEAFERLLNAKGVSFVKVARENSELFGPDYYEAGHINEESHYISQYRYTTQRDDADLVRIVEELGEKSWGRFAELKIVDVPDEVEWHISEYDGLEEVAENHRTWS